MLPPDQDNVNILQGILPNLPPFQITQVRNVVKAFLGGCGLVYPQPPCHSSFEVDCIAEGKRRGYITGETETLKRFIPAGVAMARNAYHHQPHAIQVFICFYTAFLVYLDDMFEKDIAAVQEFNHLFVTGQRQATSLLDHFADLLLEMPVVFGPVEANIMTTSTLNLVTALLIEEEFANVKVKTFSVVLHHPLPLFLCLSFDIN